MAIGPRTTYPEHNQATPDASVPSVKSGSVGEMQYIPRAVVTRDGTIMGKLVLNTVD